MEINQAVIDDIPVIVVSGRIDATNYKELETALNDQMRQNKNTIVVDLAGVEYVGSVGLRVMLAASKKLKPQQGDVRLAALQPFVWEVFETTGFAKFFSIFSNQGEAICGTKDHEITVGAKMDQISIITKFIEDLMKSYGFDKKKIMEVQMAAEEACINIANYAYPEREGNVHIVARVKDCLLLDIEDDGVPFDPIKRDVPLEKANGEEQPIGIYLIGKYVDGASYEFNGGKNILRLIKKMA